MRRYIRVFVFVWPILLFAVPTTSAATVAPDSSFDGDGRLQVYPSGLAGFEEIFNRDTVSDVTVDQEGRIIVVGSAEGFLGIDHSEALVVRFAPDGSLDKSFSGDGILHFEWEPEHSHATAVAIDHQGRIVVGGSTDSYPSLSVPAVARFLPSGVPDPSFSEDGLATVNVDGDVHGLALDTQDRVLLASRVYLSLSGEHFGAIRLTEQGAVDESFGGDGLVITHFSGAEYSSSGAIAIDASGRPVVAGRVQFSNGSAIAIARYTESGSLDPSFDGDGRVVLDFGALDGESAHEVILDEAERIVVVGNADEVTLVSRLLPDGKLDSSFSEDGRIVTNRSGLFQGESAAIDSAGRLVVAGITGGDAFLLRYAENGVQEEDIDPEGFTREDFLAPYVVTATMTIDRQGRYILAGSLATGSYGPVGLMELMGVARFIVDYSSPPSQQQPAPTPPHCHGEEATIVGTGSRDVLRGTKHKDVMVGLGGNDLLRGSGGDDLICAGAGNDTVKAGAGVDRSVCGRGRDIALVDRYDHVIGCEQVIRRGSRR